MSHYLDDFPLLGHLYDDSLLFMEQFQVILDEIGLPLSERKNYWSLCYIGVSRHVIGFLEPAHRHSSGEEKMMLGPGRRDYHSLLHTFVGHSQEDRKDSRTFEFYLSCHPCRSYISQCTLHTHRSTVPRTSGKIWTSSTNSQGHT